ncbi:MAG: hypothetical protein COT74_01865 [Bdellovibrionales bacterium CG10_big_fil_rev_8_21_14_0_10_45_34]|nr:MAG: hypothetical protein COT74_01865 [Bdellovibrionales bacterium CG10_big_fil_rev_8_21_14_0_10_45_34]
MGALLIYGCGELGSRLAGYFSKSCETQGCPYDAIYGVTQSSRSWENLRELGVVPLLNSEVLEVLKGKIVQNVVLAVPPSKASELYHREINDIVRVLKGRQEYANQRWVFISSSSVFLEDQGNVVNEDSAVNSNSLLYRSERIAASRGGTIVRLAGLYSDNKGPHMYYQKYKGPIERPLRWVNLIHYDDAARAIAHVLMSPSEFAHFTFLFSDNHPLRRQEIVTGNRVDEIGEGAGSEIMIINQRPHDNEISKRKEVSERNGIAASGKQIDSLRSWRIINASPVHTRFKASPPYGV